VISIFLPQKKKTVAFSLQVSYTHHLCGLVVRVNGQRFRRPGFNFRQSDFVRSSEFGMGSILPHEDNCEDT
jgi:hypothetical protein